MRTVKAGLAFLLLYAALPADSIGTQNGPIRLVCEERSLGKSLPGLVERSLTASPDGRHIAYEVQQNGKSSIVVDGVAQKPYDDVAYFHFSADGSHYGYAGIVSKKWKIVADGKEIGECDLTAWDNPVFSPDGKRIAYSATHGHYESPDARDSAVVDGVAGPRYGRVEWITFSPDSKQCAYLFSRERKQSEYGVVLDGVEQPRERVNFRFSPDGRIAWIVRRDGKFGVEIDGKTIVQGLDAVDLEGPFFSPDGKRAAFWAKRGKNEFVVVDGEEHKPYPRRRVPMGPRNMEPITFSADGSRVAYPAGRRVVVDGKEGEEYEMVLHDTIAFSSDGKSLAFAARKNGEFVLMRDGVPGKSYDQFGSPVFSPDGKRLAIAICDREPDTWRFLLDGKEGVKYESIGGERWAPDESRGVFSPDGRHFAYKARRKGKWVLVVDGVESAEYDSFAPNCPIRFDSPTTLHVPAFKSGEYVLITARIDK